MQDWVPVASKQRSYIFGSFLLISCKIVTVVEFNTDKSVNYMVFFCFSSNTFFSICNTCKSSVVGILHISFKASLGKRAVL